MNVSINGIDLDKISAIDVDGIHVILPEGDDMWEGFYINHPEIAAQGSNFQWLKINLEKKMKQTKFSIPNDLSNSSL